MNLSRVLSPSCLERGLTPVLHWGFFCVSVDPVAVAGNERGLTHAPGPSGSATGCSSKSFFLLYATAHPVGVNTAGDEGHPVLWESSERPDRVAKIVPWSERLSGMRLHPRIHALKAWSSLLGGLGLLSFPGYSKRA